MNIAYRLVNMIMSKRVFPKQVLEYGLGHLRDNQGETLEEVIYREVYLNIFLLDLQGISGGEEMTIDVSNLEFKPMLNNYYIVKIPKFMTNNKTIIDALSLTFGIPAGMFGLGLGGGNPITPVMWQGNVNANVEAANRLIGSVDTVPMMGTSRLRVVGENIIRIGETIPRFDNLWLRCNVAYDENLQNLNSTSIETLFRAFCFLLKSVIYNEKIVTMDKGVLHMGMDLGAIKNIIDGYSDAGETYADLLKTEIRSLLIISDPDKYRAAIETAVGRR